MAKHSIGLLAGLLLISAAAYWAKAEDIQCFAKVNGLYPILDGKFNTYRACINGQPSGEIKTCAGNTLFSFGWQACILRRFLVAFDERSFLQGSGLSGADGVSAASFTCTEEGDPDDPSIYYKNCNGMRLKGQCDKGQTWNAGVGCVDTLGSTAGNDYAGYKRLPDWDYKSNRLPCSLVDNVVKSYEAKKGTKFVMKLKGKTVAADFAFEIIASRRGLASGFTKNSIVRIMSETNIKSIDLGDTTVPGFYLGYELRPVSTEDGDITKLPGCAFVVREPPMVRRLKKMNFTAPAAATEPSPVIPAGEVTPAGCAAQGVVTGVSCAAGAACLYFTFGVCAGFAGAVCGAAIVSTANCIDTNTGGCFPADALVHLPDGASKRMDQLVIGDKVLTRDASGTVTFSDVYLFGHDDHNSYTEFVAVQTTANKLYLSHGHYMPTAHGADCRLNNPAACSQLMKRSQDVKVGDLVWALNATSGQIELDVVQQKSVEGRKGLYNPFTLSGDLVVNGVLASAHSDWFLDRVMPESYVSQIPSIYQTIMTPMRAVYRVGGANAVKYLDANLKIVEAASKLSL